MIAIVVVAVFVFSVSSFESDADWYSNEISDYTYVKSSYSFFDDTTKLAFTITDSENKYVEVSAYYKKGTNDNSNYYYIYYYEGNITIPSTVTYEGNKYTVVGLGDFAFDGCSKLTSVDLSKVNDSFTYIGDWSFSETGISEITIPSTVTSIGKYAFLDSDVESITFDETSSLQEIGEYAFSGCSKLSTLEIPDSVVSIGDSVFAGCTSLESVTIPANATIAQDTFGPDNNKLPYYKIGDIKFAEGSRYVYSTGVIYDVSSSSVFTKYELPEDVVIPEGMLNIESFYNGWTTDYTVKTISLPSTLKTIGKNAFRQYEALEEITIPAGVTSIGSGAFFKCTSLEKVVFEGDGDLTVGSQAFLGCTSLSNLNLRSNMELGGSVFNGCTSLKELTIPSGVTFTGSSTFAKNSSLESVIIEEGVTSIGVTTFANCNNLKTVIIPSSVSLIDSKAFKYSLVAEGSAIIFQGSEAPTFTDIFDGTIPSSLTVFVPIGATGYDDVNKTLYEYGVTAPTEDVVLVLNEERTLTGLAEYSSPIQLVVSSSVPSVSAEVSSDGSITLKAADNVTATITVSLEIEDVTLDEATFQVKVLKSQDTDEDGNTVTVEESVTEDGDTGQTITTTTTTVTDKTTGEELSTTTTISTSTTDESITTVATVSGNVATVKVTAGSNTSLGDVIGQANLIESVVTGDEPSPIEISTEVVIENEVIGVSVTLTLDVVKSLNNQAAEMEASVQIVVGDFDEGSMTSAQISALGSGTAFELSAVVVDENEKIIGRLHNLGNYVEAFLPYSGNLSGMGVFYIDGDGNVTDMNSTYNADREGFVFQTNHFSLFAVMETPEVVPDDPYIPPYYPDDDYPFIPPTVVDDGDSDEMVKIVACAAAAAAVAIMAMFLVVDYRKK